MIDVHTSILLIAVVYGNSVNGCWEYCNSVYILVHTVILLMTVVCHLEQILYLAVALYSPALALQAGKQGRTYKKLNIKLGSNVVCKYVCLRILF